MLAAMEEEPLLLLLQAASLMLHKPWHQEYSAYWRICERNCSLVERRGLRLAAKS